MSISNLATISFACLLSSSIGCGPTLLAVDDDSATTDTATTDAATTETGPADAGTTSAADSGSDGGPFDGEDASDDVIEPMPDLPPTAEPCPDADWPNDGSEVLESLGESSVLDWQGAGMQGLYFSYPSDDSPIPGQPTLGLTTTSDNASVFNFGATVSTMDARPLRGMRVRMRAQAAYADIEGLAGLWLRVDTASASVNLDNASDRPVFGTSSTWETHEVVLDVPDDAASLAFGSLLSGPGNYVITNPVFEVVRREVPTTSPNRRRPATALQCAEPTDAFVEEIVHYVRPDTWGPNPPLTWLEEFGRDTEMTYDGVPSLHVSGDVSTSFRGAVLWAGQKAGRRLRLTVPVRATGFSGEARLLFERAEDDTVTTRVSEPLNLEDGADWALFSVVTEFGDDPEAFANLGMDIDGSGELWVGYGVIEEVTDDVPLSPLSE